MIQKKDDGPECACCYPGGQQCESNKTRNKCIGPKDSQDMCSVEKKYKIAGNIEKHFYNINYFMILLR